MHTIKTEIENYNQATFKKCCEEVGVTLIGFTELVDGYVTAEVQFTNVMDVYWLGRAYGRDRLTTKK